MEPETKLDSTLARTHAEQALALAERDQWFDRAPWITYQDHPSGGGYDEPFDDGEMPVARVDDNQERAAIIAAHNFARTLLPEIARENLALLDNLALLKCGAETLADAFEKTLERIDAACDRAGVPQDEAGPETEPGDLVAEHETGERVSMLATAFNNLLAAHETDKARVRALEKAMRELNRVALSGADIRVLLALCNARSTSVGESLLEQSLEIDAALDKARAALADTQGGGA